MGKLNNNKGFSTVEVLFRVLLILVGAMALAVLFGEKPVAAAETKLSYNGIMFKAGEATLEQCKCSFELVKSGRRAYDLIKDGEHIAVLKFNKEGVLKKITFNDDFLNGLLKKCNCPSYSHFTEELTEKGIINDNSLLTGSRTTKTAELCVRNGNTTFHWNYSITNKNGKIDGDVTGVVYHEGDWYIDIRF